MRGLTSGFITKREYGALAACNTFEDFKLSLGDTDYCNVLQNVSTLSEEIIYKKCQEKFVAEFEFIRTSATGALATFMDFLTYPAMIKNIMFVLKRLINHARHHGNDNEFDPTDTLNKLDPLGDDPHMKLLMTYEGDQKGEGLAKLYQTVLVETPVARYFNAYFSKSKDMQSIVTETDIELIQEYILKVYMEDFFDFTQRLGGDTADLMSNSLMWASDRRTIDTIIGNVSNSLSKEGKAERNNLFCTFGTLYPNGTHGRSKSSLTEIVDVERLKETLNQYYPLLGRLFGQDSEYKWSFIADKHETKLDCLCFESQSQLAAFYGWFKLKQTELRNLKWILGCITQNNTNMQTKAGRIIEIDFNLENKRGR